MGPVFLLPAFFPLIAVLGGFLLHWATLRPVTTAAERLPLCRGAYLSFSLVLVLLAWSLTVLNPGLPFLLLALGATASFAGDFFNLQFPAAVRVLKQPLAYGIGSFAVAQTLTIAAFLSVVGVAELVDEGHLLWWLGAFVMIPAMLFGLVVYQRDRPKAIMIPAFVYGLFLGTMVALAVAAAFARGGSWVFVAVGALFFLASDAIMGATTMKGVHPRTEFQIPWFTYLAAQGLILTGFGLVR